MYHFTVVSAAIVATFAFPPLAVISVPVLIIMALGASSRRDAARRALDIDPPRGDGMTDRNKALRSW